MEQTRNCASVSLLLAAIEPQRGVVIAWSCLLQPLDAQQCSLLLSEDSAAPLPLQWLHPACYLHSLRCFVDLDNIANEVEASRTTSFHKVLK